MATDVTGLVTWNGSAAFVTHLDPAGGTATLVRLVGDHIEGAVVPLAELDTETGGVEGFAQLAHRLIAAGSRIIEERLIVYRT